jgi:hypothetical protein
MKVHTKLAILALCAAAITAIALTSQPAGTEYVDLEIVLDTSLITPKPIFYRLARDGTVEIMVEPSAFTPGQIIKPGDPIPKATGPTWREVKNPR